MDFMYKNVPLNAIVLKDNVKLILTNSNIELGHNIRFEIFSHFVCLSNISYHANSEIKVQITDNVRGRSIYIIGSGSKIHDQVNNRSVNDHLMEILIVADACRRSSAKSICVILPCYPYARSDKKDDGRCSIAGSLVANLLETAGVTRIVAVDLHASQIQGFTNLPFDNIYAMKVLATEIKGKIINENNENDFILVSPDVGGIKRVKYFAEYMKMSYVVMDKQRDYTKTSTVQSSTLYSSNIQTQGKTAILIDDMIDTCGTMVAAANELVNNYQFKNIFLVATHGIFSGPAIDRINNCEAIAGVIVTDSLPQYIHGKTIVKPFYVVSLAPLLSQVIERLETGGSVSELF